MAGRIAPPKKRRNQRSAATGGKLVKKQIGAEQQKHKRAIMQLTLIAFSD